MNNLAGENPSLTIDLISSRRVKSSEKRKDSRYRVEPNEVSIQKGAIRMSAEDRGSPCGVSCVGEFLSVKNPFVFICVNNTHHS